MFGTLVKRSVDPVSDTFANFLVNTTPARDSPPLTPQALLPLMSPKARGSAQLAIRNLTTGATSERFPLTSTRPVFVVCESLVSGVRLPVPVALSAEHLDWRYVEKTKIVQSRRHHEKNGRKDNLRLQNRAMELYRADRFRSPQVQKRRQIIPSGPGGGVVISDDAPWYEMLDEVSAPRFRDICPACAVSLPPDQLFMNEQVLQNYSLRSMAIAHRMRTSYKKSVLPTAEEANELANEFSGDMDWLIDENAKVRTLYKSLQVPVVRIPKTHPIKKIRFPDTPLYMCMVPSCGCVWREQSKVLKCSKDPDAMAFRVLASAFTARTLKNSQARTESVALDPVVPQIKKPEPRKRKRESTEDKREDGSDSEDEIQPRAKKNAPLRSTAEGSLGKDPEEPKPMAEASSSKRAKKTPKKKAAPKAKKKATPKAKKKAAPKAKKKAAPKAKKKAAPKKKASPATKRSSRTRKGKEEAVEDEDNAGGSLGDLLGGLGSISSDDDE